MSGSCTATESWWSNKYVPLLLISHTLAPADVAISLSMEGAREILNVQAALI
jgi:hypothetical protein